MCIKCGKLPLALEIYNNMRAANCMPNVVTYNTLVDVYGKLGRWERAIHVLDLMKQEVGAFIMYLVWQFGLHAR